MNNIISVIRMSMAWQTKHLDYGAYIMDMIVINIFFTQRFKRIQDSTLEEMKIMLACIHQRTCIRTISLSNIDVLHFTLW